MPTSAFLLTTTSRTITYSVCKGAEEVCTSTLGGTFDEPLQERGHQPIATVLAL